MSCSKKLAPEEFFKKLIRFRLHGGDKRLLIVRSLLSLPCHDIRNTKVHTHAQRDRETGQQVITDTAKARGSTPLTPPTIQRPHAQGIDQLPR